MLKHSRSFRATTPAGVAASGTQESPRASARSAKSAVYSAILLAFAVWLLGATPASAQDGAQAGLVIVHSDGSVTTQCVAFAEESITGAELLVRSGLDVAMEASSMGATICRLDGEGCDYPQESCFCQCEGSPCIYWSYWRLGNEGWTYSNLGAGNATVRAGDVDGWRWGEGRIDRAESPPAVTFDEICAGETEGLAVESVAGTENSAEEPEDEVVEKSDDGEPAAVAATAGTVSESDARQVSGAATGSTGSAVTSGTGIGIEPVTVLAIVIGLAVALPLAALAIALLRRRGGGKRA